MNIEDFKNYLSEYGPKIYDAWASEPICWGYKIISHLGDDKFRQLSMLGEMECIYPNWYLITKKLTREEAEKKYGKITDEEFGPRGGWKSVTFGSKKFISRYLRA